MEMQVPENYSRNIKMDIPHESISTAVSLYSLSYENTLQASSHYSDRYMASHHFLCLPHPAVVQAYLLAFHLQKNPVVLSFSEEIHHHWNTQNVQTVPGFYENSVRWYAS